MRSSPWTTWAPVRAAISAPSVVLPDPAGPSTHTSRPGPSVAGLDEASATTRSATSEGEPVPTVGLDLLDEAGTGQQLHRVRVLEGLAGLGVPEPHEVAHGQQRRGVAGQRGLH